MTLYNRLSRLHTIHAATFIGVVFTAVPFAQAEDWSASANVALTSDYVFRGVTQTDEHPAIQGGFDLAHAGGFYAGVWGSNVDFNDGDEAGIETDLYAGFKGTAGAALGWDVGALYYAYPGADGSLNYDYWEGKAGVSYTVSGVAFEPGLGFAVYYSPEFFGNTGPATYVNGSLGLTLTDTLDLTASVGHQQFSDSGPIDYNDWKVAIRTEFAGIGMELGYTDTDLKDSECGAPDWCNGRVVFTLSKSL